MCKIVWMICMKKVQAKKRIIELKNEANSHKNNEKQFE